MTESVGTVMPVLIPMKFPESGFSTDNKKLNLKEEWEIGKALYDQNICRPHEDEVCKNPYEQAEKYWEKFKNFLFPPEKSWA